MSSHLGSPLKTSLQPLLYSSCQGRVPSKSIEWENPVQFLMEHCTETTWLSFLLRCCIGDENISLKTPQKEIFISFRTLQCLVKGGVPWIKQPTLLSVSEKYLGLTGYLPLDRKCLTDLWYQWLSAQISCHRLHYLCNFIKCWIPNYLAHLRWINLYRFKAMTVWRCLRYMYAPISLPSDHQKISIIWHWSFDFWFSMQ